MQTSSKQTKYEMTRIRDMVDVKEMPTDSLLKETTSRSIKGNGSIIVAFHNALKKDGLENNTKFDEIQKAETENEMRLHALMVELISRGIDWIVCYHRPKQGDVAHA